MKRFGTLKEGGAQAEGGPSEVGRVSPGQIIAHFGYAAFKTSTEYTLDQCLFIIIVENASGCIHHDNFGVSF